MNPDFVKILRNNGFNCFPIKPGEKIADSRYNAAKTIPNQEINEDDNFGYIPIEGMGTCIVDFDDKKYEDHLKKYAEKVMIIDTPHGFHMPVKGISGSIGKIELFDYDVQDKKIVEIQGPNHYCVGPSCELHGKYTNENESLEYKNIGTNEILDVKNMDFHDFVQSICKSFNVVGKLKNASNYSHLREKFKEGKIPGPGQSNDYFNQAALVCNTEGKTRDETIETIRRIYDKWSSSNDYSGRPWSNIEAKINEVYDNDLKIHHGGHKKKQKTDDIDEIVSNVFTRYKLYSDKENVIIYQEMNGFVKTVTTSLKYEITREFNTDIHTTNEVMHKIIANSPNLPEIDEDIIVFKNGYYRISDKSFHDHDDSHGLAVIGFEKYNFIKDPICPKYEKFMNDTFPDEQARKYAYIAASCAIVPEQQERITMCYGEAGTGKTTYRETLENILGVYAKKIDDNSLFKDQFGLADWANKTFISLAEAPKNIKEFDKLKRITGESSLTIRKMHQSPSVVPNYTKIIIDANNLFRVPEDEAGPMFDRLHLLEFHKRFRNTDKMIKRLSTVLYKEEGEHILSFLLQKYDIMNEYPTPKETKDRWEDISIPEKRIFKKLFEYKKDSEGLSPMDIKLKMEGEDSIEVDMNVVRKLAKDAGYTITNGLYRGISVKQTDIGEMGKYT